MVNITPVAKAQSFTRAIRRSAKPKPGYKISPIEKPGKTTSLLSKQQQNELAVNKYLTNDTTYQQQVAAINKALGDYTANEGNSEVQYNNSYAQNRYDLNQERDQSGIDQKADFAARGFLRSGGHAVADSNRLNNYANRQSVLDMNRGSFLQNAQTDLSNFRSSQALAQQQARQDAINRRALGLLGGP